MFLYDRYKAKRTARQWSLSLKSVSLRRPARRESLPKNGETLKPTSSYGILCYGSNAVSECEDRSLEAHLNANPIHYLEPLFSTGIALENDKVIGAIVLTVDDEPDAALSYWEVTRRAGCVPTLLTMCYDQVLEEPLEPHECLIDFLAVSAEARGKGVGAKLIHWAEQAATDILRRRVPEAVADHGVLMTLWVAADNSPATRLYHKESYKVVRRTDESLHACFSSCILQRFLGHAVWVKMHKALPAPDALKQPVMAPKQALAQTANVELIVSAGKLPLQEVSTSSQVNITASPEAAAANAAATETTAKRRSRHTDSSIHHEPQEITYCSPVCEIIGMGENNEKNSEDPPVTAFLVKA